ncbi:MAG: cysteine--tRNA ligase [Clostridia bacterium]|nr:cysteine--tRNA ligase [Clostridia bacterium]
MKLYNTLTGKKEEFTVNGPVTIYSCGPTVYNFFHIGNARPFVTFDLLRRYLKYRGNDVTFVQNFTDVDDKMIRRAAEEGTDIQTVADKYIAEYRVDAEGLGITPADVHHRATEEIDSIIKIVETLVERGYAYESEGDVYFSTRKFADYGKLSKIDVDDLESGARIEIGEKKRDPLDFTLWKAKKEGEPAWPSPWGEGRPGWHIECSAMSSKYLGEHIDIHCGGADLAFPHHENEIAQSEAAFGAPFARFWLHNGYINVDSKKMSKSLGNFFTVRDAAATYGYDAIRFFLLSAQYRSPVNFTSESLTQAKSALTRLYNCEGNLRFALDNPAENAAEYEVEEMISRHRASFCEAMDDDLNTADAIGVLFEYVREANAVLAKNPAPATTKALLDFYLELSGLLGFVAPKQEASDEDAKIDELVAERTAAKKEKNFARADEIRNELSAMGIVLEDTAQGTKWHRA